MSIPNNGPSILVAFEVKFNLNLGITVKVYFVGVLKKGIQIKSPLLLVAYL